MEAAHVREHRIGIDMHHVLPLRHHVQHRCVQPLATAASDEDLIDRIQVAYASQVIQTIQTLAPSVARATGRMAILADNQSIGAEIPRLEVLY